MQLGVTYHSADSGIVFNLPGINDLHIQIVFTVTGQQLRVLRRLVPGSPLPLMLCFWVERSGHLVYSRILHLIEYSGNIGRAPREKPAKRFAKLVNILVVSPGSVTLYTSLITYSSSSHSGIAHFSRKKKCIAQ